MDPKKEEALKAKEMAEKRFTEKDFTGARHYALKAQGLYPGLEGISQMVSTFDIYVASKTELNGEIDYYSVLKLNPSADKNKVKKQYRKMAVLLHPDKNKTIGADGAFKLISEAWCLLSDNVRRSSYDLKRRDRLSSHVELSNLASAHTVGVGGTTYDIFKSAPTNQRLDTFWTVCTSCQIQYEYLRKYLNKRLSCKNCRGVFMAVETGEAPVEGYHPWNYASANGYGGSHGHNGPTYVPSSSHTSFSGHTSEYVSNMSFQWTSGSGTSAGNGNPNGSSTVYQKTNGKIKRREEKMKAAHRLANHTKTSMVNAAASTMSISSNEISFSKIGTADKKMKVDTGESSKYIYEQRRTKSDSEKKLTDGNASANGCSANFPTFIELPPFDVRKMLIEKAKTVVRKKLEEKIAEEQIEVSRSMEAAEKENSDVSKNKPVLIRMPSMSITVPDPDFHNFDKDRSEECFKPKQVWAIYDEEDGMPRLYCIIREIISVNPFKSHLTYLNSRTDREFGEVNWISYGFTKSCGNFKAMHSDFVDQVNIFSHILTGAKAGRGGCVRIYPKSGEIWAVYRNWTEEWDPSTPDDVRHQYEMVEVVTDYAEDLGVTVNPLVKLTGYKTVYQRNRDNNAVRWIPRREMLRFSHQVPSCVLNGLVSDFPDGCWDLDPAATPNELLHSAAEESIPEPVKPAASCLLNGVVPDLPDRCWDLDPAATPNELLHSAAEESKPEPLKPSADQELKQDEYFQLL